MVRSKFRSALQGSSGDALVLALLLAGASALVWPDLFIGWNYSDDGGLAHVAERVMRGELPHRDFEDPWTGGWSFFQALLFRVGGVRLSLLRTPIFAAWLVAVAGVYAIGRQFGGRFAAASMAAAGAVWSLYVYHLPLLGWYYAPFAVIGCWMLLRFDRSGQRRWLVLGGACAAGALLVKITGLFVLAAMLLWLLDRAGRSAGGDRVNRWRGYWVLVATMALLWGGAVGLLIRGMPRDMYSAAALHFLLPNVLLGAWLARRAFLSGSDMRHGVRSLVSTVGWLLVGVAAGFAPLLTYYAWHGALGELALGVLVRPSVRLAGYAFAPPAGVGTLMALMSPVVMMAGLRAAKPARGPFVLVVAIVLGACSGLALRAMWPGWISTLVLAVRSMPIVLPLFAMLWDTEADVVDTRRSAVLLLVALVTTTQLVQVPFAWYPYFFYNAPLAVLGIWSLMRTQGSAGSLIAAFWIAQLLGGGLDHVPGRRDAANEPQFAALPFAQAGITVSVLDSVRYARVARVVSARPAGPLIALGNAPEFFVLLGRRNATPMVYDFVASPEQRNSENFRALLDREPQAIVIVRHALTDSDSLFQSMVGVARAHLPCAAEVANFEIRWRSRGDHSDVLACDAAQTGPVVRPK